jgi:hypothetical protein
LFGERILSHQGLEPSGTTTIRVHNHQGIKPSGYITIRESTHQGFINIRFGGENISQNWFAV